MQALNDRVKAETPSMFPESETTSLDFGLPLTQKYQPTRISEFVGLDTPKAILASLLKHPKPCSLIFCGPTVEEVERTWNHAQFFPGTRSPYWVIVVDEAESMSFAAQRALLSHLDSTAALRPTFGGGSEHCKPLPIIWIFTCNGRGMSQTDLPDTFEPRFRSRCLPPVKFSRLNGELAPWLAGIWKSETDANPETLPDFKTIAREANGQVRDALQALELAIMNPTVAIKTEEDAEPTPTATLAPALTLRAPQPVTLYDLQRQENDAFWAARP